MQMFTDQILMVTKEQIEAIEILNQHINSNLKEFEKKGLFIEKQDNYVLETVNYNDGMIGLDFKFLYSSNKELEDEEIQSIVLPCDKL